MISGSYLIILAIWLLLRTLFEDRWWWLGLLNSLTPYWFALVPIIFLIASATHQRILWFGSVIGAMVFMWLFGGLFVMQLGTKPPSAHTLTVMSYNLLGTNRDFASITVTLADAQADVVGLQELNSDIAGALRLQLSNQYPYQIVTQGSGVISRYPLTHTGSTLSGNWHEPYPIYQFDFAGKPVTLLNLQTYASGFGGDTTFKQWVWRERERQAQTITDIAKQTATPLIITADFNATDQSHAYRIVTHSLGDAWREAGWGLGHTFPGGPSPGIWRPSIAGSPIPMWLVRIDYVFHSTDWDTVHVRLGRWDGVSDHRPVIATLQLK